MGEEGPAGFVSLHSRRCSEMLSDRDNLSQGRLVKFDEVDLLGLRFGNFWRSSRQPIENTSVPDLP